MMKLMIEIPDEVYKSAKNGELNDIQTMFICGSVSNGKTLDSIIAEIEAARDKDKLCEYPYNRCIEIMRKAAGNED